MSDDRAARIGKNEAVYRQVNEQIEDLSRKNSPNTGGFDVLCECGDLECMQRFTVAIAVYERTREDSTRFIILPGHEIGDVETIVESYEHFVIVQKTAPDAIRQAIDTDERT